MIAQSCGVFSTIAGNIIFFFNFHLLSWFIHPVKIPGSGNFCLFSITYFCNRLIKMWHSGIDKKYIGYKGNDRRKYGR
jgi:hypothetical protein